MSVPGDIAGWWGVSEEMPAGSGRSLLAWATGIIADISEDRGRNPGGVPRPGLLSTSRRIPSAMFSVGASTCARRDPMRIGEGIGRFAVPCAIMRHASRGDNVQFFLPNYRSAQL